MAREKPDYWDNMALLNARFPDRDMLSIADLCPVFGYKDKRSLKGRLSRAGITIDGGRVSKVAIAHHMCN